MSSVKIETPDHIKVGSVYTVPGNGRSNRLTIKIIEIMSTRRMESGYVFTTVYAWRVRPYDHNVTFGREHVYIAHPEQYQSV